jgi:hypothetical protein
MKYEIKGEKDDDRDDFQIHEIRIIKARTRARVMTWMVAIWLVVMLAVVGAALAARQPTEAHRVLEVLTHFVALGFGWYFGSRQGT